MSLADLVANLAGPGIGAGAVATGAVVAVLTGRLIPRWTHRRILDAERRASDAFAQAATIHERRAERLSAQLDALIAATGRQGSGQ